MSQVAAQTGVATRRLPDEPDSSAPPTGSATRRLPETAVNPPSPTSSATRRLPESESPPPTGAATRRLPESQIQTPPPAQQAPTFKFNHNNPQTPPPPPPPPPAYTPPHAQGSAGQAAKPFWQNPRILAFGLLGILVLGGMIWGVMQLFGGFSSNQILAANANRGGDFDLYLMELGGEAADEQLIAEEVYGLDRTTLNVMQNDRYVTGLDSDRRLGIFLPDSSWLMFAHYNEDGELMVQQMESGDEAPLDVYDTKRTLWGVAHLDSEMVTVREDRDDNERCYAAAFGEELERIAKADNCYFSTDGSTLFTRERDANTVTETNENGNEVSTFRDEVTVTAMDIDGENEVILIDTDEPINNIQTAWDGSHVAYVKIDEGEAQLFLVERATATETAISSTFSSIWRYGFANQADRLYYIGVDEDEVLNLYTTDDGQALADGNYIQALFNDSGTRLLYTIGDELDELDAYIFNVETKETTQIASGENLSIAYVSGSEWFLVTEKTADNELIITSSDMDGANIHILLEEDELAVSQMQTVIGGEFLYISLNGEDGSSLFVTPLDRAEGFYAIDEWLGFHLLNVSDDESHLAYLAQEDAGDDVILYGIALEDGAREVELDDEVEDGVQNAVYSSNGSFVLYTAVTGNDVDERAIMQVQRDGESSAELVYDERVLVDVAWDELEPFQRVWFLDPPSR
ncbi:MAG: hypothetical protein AAF614_23615 [Chloroflexota bacterium]